MSGRLCSPGWTHASARKRISSPIRSCTYDQGVMSREQIREDLKKYAARWPQRRFWFDGDIVVEPQNGNRVKVTFPLRYALRNGAQDSSGKINKTLVLELVGEDQQIVAVGERKAE